MKLSKVIKIKKGYVWIDTCKLESELVTMINIMGFGNSDAVAGEYETMIFKCKKTGEVTNWKHLDKANYKTAKLAEAGHEKMIKKWQKK